MSEIIFEVENEPDFKGWEWDFDSSGLDNLIAEISENAAQVVLMQIQEDCKLAWIDDTTVVVPILEWVFIKVDLEKVIDREIRDEPEKKEQLSQMFRRLADKLDGKP